MPRLLSLVLALLFVHSASASDLTIGWISRSPDIEYVWNSSNPKVEGWPAEGSTVTWRAHVRSWFDAPQTIAYTWSVDGTPVRSGTATIATGGYTTIDLPRTWMFRRERLSIAIDTANAIVEQSEKNNALEVFTDALSVGFWVEQSVYDHFRGNQDRLGIGSTSFEDFAQRTIATYNEMAALAVYDLTPNGVADRWRLQKIVVVPDDALPLVPPADPQLGNEPGGASAQPDSSDRTIDLQWGFPKKVIAGYDDYTTVSTSNPFYVPYVIIHEIGHARYLTDVYAFDVLYNSPVNTIDIPGFPRTRGYVYYAGEQGLMNRTYTFIDRYSAVALNLIAGHRAIAGNYNDPENVGSFLNDLPSQNRLTIRDAEGNLMTDADVDIWQSKLDRIDAWYPTHYEGDPDLRLRTDANGQVLVGRNPFATNGPVVSYFRENNTVAIVRVTKGTNVKFGFLESRIFNLAWWAGNTTFADHELVVGRSAPCGYRGPILAGPAWDTKLTGPFTKLSWRRVENATRYTVYSASLASPVPRIIARTENLEATAALVGGAGTYWWVEAQFANSCPPLRSDASRVDAPSAPARRRSVGRR